MKSELEIIKESLKVENDSVTFRTRTGRGSGSGVKIPASQFQEFIRIMTEMQTKLVVPASPTENTES